METVKEQSRPLVYMIWDKVYELLVNYLDIKSRIEAVKTSDSRRRVEPIQLCLDQTLI